MRKLRLAATAAAAAPVLLFTSIGVSSAAPVHQASPATPLHATLTADTTGSVYLGTFNCPTTGIAAVACAIAVEMQMEETEMAFLASQLGSGVSWGFSSTTSASGGVTSTSLWAVPVDQLKTGTKQPPPPTKSPAL